MAGAGIFCIGPTPALQRVMVFKRLEFDEVNRAISTLDGIAGKGVNVAKVLKQLGVSPVLFGFAGGASGEHLKSTLSARQIRHHLVQVEPVTRRCITVLDQDAGTQTELVEESKAVSESAYAQLLEALRNEAPAPAALVCSGTLTPGAPQAFYRDCVALANERGAIAILDAQGPALLDALSAKPRLVKPNRAEVAKTLGRTIETETEMRAAAAELQERGAVAVVFTSGARPALAFQGTSAWRITSPQIKPVNPIGSGDSFTAALTWRLLAGDDLGAACRWGAAAGAANALTLMAAEFESAEMERLARSVSIEQISR
jgi:tagatose 6-phosphate kinase